MPYHEPAIIERRELGALRQISLLAPELARAARPGHYVLASCAPPGSADPLLRRVAFLAGADPAAGTAELLIDPDERGLDWLAAQPVGARLDLFGPLGTPFALDGRTRNLLLAGAGPALPALIFLARAAAAGGGAVVLLAAAAGAARLPPPFLLPPDLEYQSSAEGPAALAGLLGAPSPGGSIFASPIAWADQICLALTENLIAPAADAVRAGRMRWGRGFAQAAIAGPILCGVGACQACLIDTRHGLRTRCKDGPVFDLRDLRG
jgi:dihydroorotate dehydrogenase electron transfer subunit